MYKFLINSNFTIIKNSNSIILDDNHIDNSNKF